MPTTSKTRLDKILPEVPAWSSDMWPLSGWMDEYLAGQGEVVLATSDLFKAGMMEVGQSLLSAREGQLSPAIQHMASGFVRMLFSEMLTILCLKGTDRIISNDLDGMTQLMLGAVAMGQPQLVEPFHRVVFDGIDGGYGVHDGHNLPLGSTLRYAAFGLSIIGDWLGKPLDIDKHALPRDPAWGLLVANWREPDPDKLLPILMTACDTHVERIAVTGREVDTQSAKFEFGSVFEAVHPTEILAILRLRELLGLRNPLTIDHPLMQTPYAQITCSPLFLTSRNFHDELLEQFLRTVRRRDPQVLPAGM
ncbi:MULTISPECIES: hypothetical protein [Burkholderia]|uniref:Uncharacterized protein n=1 Tax=Burkholderia aenigmatica TaxID=2015348 RepID=A0ABY6Y0N0_9BURK|nr:MULTISPECIES: hypothetical protein [Burkholderia]VWC94319.1 hypothetical protein BLA17378_04792 [Burkholderia aenigmatica]VWD29544.1 hypothetical protein BLA18628_04503 [Burkholderia aenigmatica]